LKRSFRVVASILDRSVSIFVHQMLAVLAIVVSMLVLVVVVGLIAYALLLSRYVSLVLVVFAAILIAPPLAASALSELATAEQQGSRRSFVLILRSSLARVAVQLPTVAVLQALGITALVVSATAISSVAQKMLVRYPQGSDAVGIVLFPALVLIPSAVIALTSEIASVTVCVSRWEEVSVIGAAVAATRRLFSRKEVATSLILIFTLLAIQFVIRLAEDGALWVVSDRMPLWMIGWVFGTGEVVFGAYAALSFAVYYRSLAPIAAPTRPVLP
jgi:hypothetical protein